MNRLCLLQGACALAGAALIGLTLAGPAQSAPPPRPARVSSATIDAALRQAWSAAEVPPLSRCDDATFLRRASLDLTGALPSPADVEAFLADSKPDKRARLVERLLQEPRRAAHLARWTSEFLLGALEDTPEVRPFLASFRGWLEEAFAQDRPWSAIAARLVAVEGTTNEDPSLLYAVRYGRAGNEDLAGAVAKHFLGLSLECARCHDHPFNDWKQADFQALAAVFVRARLRPLRPGVLRLSEAPVGEHRYRTPAGETHTVEPRYPGQRRALRAKPPMAPRSEGSPLFGTTRTSRRAAFARWLSAPGNPYLSRNLVNLTWERFFGAPLVEDGLDAPQDSPHAGLLERLAAEVEASGFSLRSLERAIVNSQAYQRASTSPKPAYLSQARVLFAAARVRPLSAPVLVDALLSAGGRAQPRSGELPGLYQRTRERLIAELGRIQPERPEPGQATPGEALWWLNGRAPTGLSRGLALREVRKHRTPRAQVRALFLRTLSRLPSAEELSAAQSYLAAHRGEPEAALSDVLWSLLATSEFSSNH